MQIFGHRGAGGEAPENTIEACRHAIVRGARNIEVDLRLSADDQLMVIHDKTVDRTTYSTGEVRNLTAKSLNKMDCRRSGPPWPKRCAIPTLDQLLEHTPEINCYQLEVKSDTRKMMVTVANLLGEKFPSPKAARNIIVISFDYYFLRTLRDLAPHIRCGVVANKLDAFAAAQELGCSHYCVNWSACKPQFVRKLHRANMQVAVWTVNDARAIQNLYRMKVDAVTTDYPSMGVPQLAALER